MTSACGGSVRAREHVEVLQRVVERRSRVRAASRRSGRAGSRPVAGRSQLSDRRRSETKPTRSRRARYCARRATLRRGRPGRACSRARAATSAKLSRKSTTSLLRSGCCSFTYSSPRRALARQFTRRTRSPDANGRRSANSIPSPVRARDAVAGEQLRLERREQRAQQLARAGRPAARPRGRALLVGRRARSGRARAATIGPSAYAPQRSQRERSSGSVASLAVGEPDERGSAPSRELEAVREHERDARALVRRAPGQLERRRRSRRPRARARGGRDVDREVGRPRPSRSASDEERARTAPRARRAPAGRAKSAASSADRRERRVRAEPAATPTRVIRAARRRPRRPASGRSRASSRTTSSGRTRCTQSSGRSVSRWASAGTATAFTSSGVTKSRPRSAARQRASLSSASDPRGLAPDLRRARSSRVAATTSTM